MCLARRPDPSNTATDFDLGQTTGLGTCVIDLVGGSDSSRIYRRSGLKVPEHDACVFLYGSKSALEALQQLSPHDPLPRTYDVRLHD